MQKNLVLSSSVNKEHQHMVLEIFLAKLFSYSIIGMKGKYCSFLFQKYSQVGLVFCLQQLVSPQACWYRELSMNMLYFFWYLQYPCLQPEAKGGKNDESVSNILHFMCSPSWSEGLSNGGRQHCLINGTRQTHVNGKRHIGDIMWPTDASMICWH